MEFKIPFHSVIDIITNSSTEIYTYSNGSEKAFKEVIEEMFKINGLDKKFDDVFIATINSDIYSYTESDLMPKDMTSDDVNKLLKDIENGVAEKPQWMKDVEEENNWDYFTPETYLTIRTKDDKYEKFGKLVTSFLYSTSHEATYNG